MADENTTDAAGNRPLFGKPSAEPEVEKTAVSDVVQGETSPGIVPSFGKRDGADENINLQNKDEARSIEEGSAASSGNVGVDYDAIAAAAAAGPEAPSGERNVQYATPRIANFKLGKYQFENGVLNLSAENAEQFDALLAKCDPSIQSTVMKIDRDGGDAVAKRFLDTQRGPMTRGPDVTTNAPPAPNPSESQEA
jgi:hypothetical protein